MTRIRKTEVKKVTWGLPNPINERLRLKLLVSEELRKKRGIGTTRDRVERQIEGHLYAEATRDI